MKRPAEPVFVWCPQYCFCTYEGGFVDLALCWTRAKARGILREHKKENILRGRDGRKYSWQVWKVVKREIV